MTKSVSKNVLIKNCNLIDGISESIQSDVDILISDGSILEIGKSLDTPDETEILDLSGKTVLPGLIDAHVHLAFDASGDPVGHLINDPAETTLIKMVINCQKSVQHGVTTVRDLGAPSELILALRDAWKQKILIGPRMIVSGKVITTKRGHCYYVGHEVDGVKAASEAVEEEINKGVDVIKIMTSGGSLTPGSSVHVPQFCVDEIRAVVQKAHQQGLKVAAHANATQGIKNAVLAGMDSIEHGSFADDETLELMCQAGTWLVPTMSPADVLLKSPLITEKRRSDIQFNWDSRRKVVEKAIGMGLKMASGTDAGITYMEHGSVALEISLFKQLGMAPMKAIWTATSWAADLLGIGEEVGTLIEGKKADLIAVQGDPLSDLSLLESPALIMIDGQVLDRRSVMAWN